MNGVECIAVPGRPETVDHGRGHTAPGRTTLWSEMCRCTTPIIQFLAVLAPLMRPQKHLPASVSSAVLGFKRVGLHYIAFSELDCKDKTCLAFQHQQSTNLAPPRRTSASASFGQRSNPPNSPTNIASLIKPGVHGFDSSEGLPEDWKQGHERERLQWLRCLRYSPTSSCIRDCLKK